MLWDKRPAVFSRFFCFPPLPAFAAACPRIRIGLAGIALPTRSPAPRSQSQPPPPPPESRVKSRDKQSGRFRKPPANLLGWSGKRIGLDDDEPPRYREKTILGSSPSIAADFAERLANQSRRGHAAQTDHYPDAMASFAGGRPSGWRRGWGNPSIFLGALAERGQNSIIFRRQAHVSPPIAAS